jgi:tetratricopeptide (TPR) repeat protein
MPAVAAYLRALACIAQKNAALAEEYLRKAIEAQPANGEAVRMLASLYFQRREYEHVAALYRRSGAGLFTEYPESVAQVALSLSKIGDARSAVGLLTEGTRRFPDDRSLALVASQMASAAPRR